MVPGGVEVGITEGHHLSFCPGLHLGADFYPTECGILAGNAQAQVTTDRGVGVTAMGFYGGARFEQAKNPRDHVGNFFEETLSWRNLC